MPRFYRGAGVGTYWYLNDAQVVGFTARNTQITPSSSVMVDHIAGNTTASPYISLTRSYSVAWSYAVFMGLTTPATRGNPGYVYHIDMDDPVPPGLQLLDPIVEIGSQLPTPLSPIPYQHDGLPDFLLGVANPKLMGPYLRALIKQPPGSTNTPRSANLTPQFETIVHTLRDAELLATGFIPSRNVVFRTDAFI